MRTFKTTAIAVALSACFAPGIASAFNSASTGADGPFSPTASVTVTLPPGGIFNYTTVNIPAGVTVSYVRNSANTPVVILASGDVILAGTGTCLGPLVTGIGGATYGSSTILPLIGGSGGGGGSGGVSFPGAGGGGGGGAILIASSGTINLTGSIVASGGAGGSGAGANLGGAGGGGSGGAVRLVATTITGNGPISAGSGPAGTVPCCQFGFVGAAGDGAPGRIRLEAETFNRTAGTSPAASIALPGPVFVAGAPTLTIASVAGVSAPANPTGNADITLAATTPNPVTVVFTTSGVPVGNIVQLTVVPAFGPKTVTVTPALTGSTASASASVAVTLPVGSSVLQAQTTFTIVAALGDLLRNFAGNERVERITLSATYGGKSKATLITVSGKEYEAPAEAMRIAALGAGR